MNGIHDYTFKLLLCQISFLLYLSMIKKTDILMLRVNHHIPTFVRLILQRQANSSNP